MGVSKITKGMNSEKKALQHQRGRRAGTGEAGGRMETKRMWWPKSHREKVKSGLSQTVEIHFPHLLNGNINVSYEVIVRVMS